MKVLYYLYINGDFIAAFDKQSQAYGYAINKYPHKSYNIIPNYV